MMFFSRHNNAVFSAEGVTFKLFKADRGKTKVYYLRAFGDHIPDGEMDVETYDNEKDARDALLFIVERTKAITIPRGENKDVF